MEGMNKQDHSEGSKCRAEGQHSRVSQLALWALGLKHGSGSPVLVTSHQGVLLDMDCSG